MPQSCNKIFEYIATCDKCGFKDTMLSNEDIWMERKPSAREAMRLWRAEGWGFVPLKNTAICRDCRKGRKSW